MSVQPAPGGTFANLNYPTFLFAGAVVVGSVVLVEQVAPQHALPMGAALLLGVGLLWHDGSGKNAATLTGEALASALGAISRGSGIAPNTPPSPTSPRPTPLGGVPTNPLPGLNLGSLFGSPGIHITTPFGWGSQPGQTYSFGGLTVHRGVDVIPKGFTSAQAIGRSVYNVLAGTVVGLIPGDAEHRGVVLQVAPNQYEHVYHIDPTSLRPGQYVPAGGLLGSIANMAGAHVHYELRTSAGQNGIAMDPTGYLR